MAGVFNLGGIVEAFSPSKMERVYNSPELQGQIATSIGGLDQYRGKAGEALGSYEAANRRAIEESRRLGAMTEGEIGGLLSGLRGASYLADRERTREGDLAALNTLLGQLGGGMSRADKAAASRLGYAGRPSSSYMDKQRSSYIGAFGAPIASQIFAGLNPAAAGAAQERGANVGQQLGLMDYRRQIPMGMAEMELNPLQALQAARQSEIGQLGGLSDVARSNLAGFKENRNKWAQALGAVDQSLNSALDTYMSAYSGGMLGGGQGLFGGLLGGERARATRPQSNPMFFGMPNQGFGGSYSAPAPVNYGLTMTAPIGYQPYVAPAPPLQNWGLSYSLNP